MSFSPLRLAAAVRLFLLVFAIVGCSAAMRVDAQNPASQPNSAATTAPVQPSQAPVTQSGDPAAADSNHKAPATPLTLGVGDLIEMTVYNVPELSTKTRISSKGEMYCPLIGYLHVAGLSSEEAQNAVEEKLSGFVKNPHVSLFVAEYASQGASILGEVAKPGIYPVLGQQHLFDLISAAGGLSDKAGRSASVTHRTEPDKPITVTLSRNLTDDPQTNVPVYPGDTVIVRKADIVYVVGDVSRPSGLLMDAGGVTVLQAVALAGGTTRTAKLNGSKILHKDGTGGMKETKIELKKMLQAKVPDVELQPNDILIIPSSTGKILVGRGLEAAMQAATMVSVAAMP
jgi:polysaccharide export outer membrane protein